MSLEYDRLGMMSITDGLNERQAEAVVHTGGPLVIIAGAGSGKTRVLTHRMAWLIEEGMKPWEILAITFTNKAAGEMKERIVGMLGEKVTSDMWVSTFHSSCVRILRSHAEKLGYRKDFSIYDSSDSVRVVRDVMRDLDMDTKENPPAGFQSIISSFKNQGMDALKFEEEAVHPKKDEILPIFMKYEKKLFESNAMDFDDLLLNVVKVFEDQPSVLKAYREKFQHVLVDEYQDTNVVQNRMIVLLTEGREGITIVGDEAQSIYKFRGADFRNLVEFKERFPAATIVKLEQNYRSTQNILDTANRVISHNAVREEKTLWSDNPDGEEVKFIEHDTERTEASFVVNEIRRLVNQGYEWADFAVFYRMNAMSRILEETFVEADVPHKVIGGMRFYDRKEIKDMLAWLRVVVNPSDELAVRRAIAAPKRGVGDGTLNKVVTKAAESRVSFYDALRSAGIGGKAGKGIGSFTNVIDMVRVGGESQPEKVLQLILDESGYLDILLNEDTPEAQGRVENLKEMVSAASEFETISEYLHHVSLLSDADSIDADEAVKLMTLHTSKGLEFPVVFIVGLEESVFPHSRSLDSEEDIEEERRLMYVGVTRAEKILYVNWCDTRWMFNNVMQNPKSRFVSEAKGLESKVGGVRIKDEPTPSVSLKTSSTWNVGDKAHHKTWGMGTVVSLSGEGGDSEIVMNFDNTEIGEKTLLLAWAPIVKIS